MSKSTQQKHALQVLPGKDGAKVTRRSVLAGAAAATAATLGSDIPALAQANQTLTDLDVFVTLSSALTGIAAGRLKPFADSLDLSKEYFDRVTDWAAKKPSTALTTLLQVARSTSLPASKDDGIVKQPDVDRLVKSIETQGDEPKYLTRSIVLMWYLGSWYEPDDLKTLPLTAPSFIKHTVISPKAYTQGWVWRVAQAHPMGYSDMQFGYWTREPPPLSDFIANHDARKRS
jgi:hypothetical protein